VYESTLNHPGWMPPPGDESPRGRRRRYWRPVFATILVLLAIIGLLDWHYAGHYDVFVPGEAPNAEARITVKAPAAGTPACAGSSLCVHDRSGAIHLTTVGVFYGAPIFQLVQAKLNPRDAIYPETEYPNSPGAEVSAMDTSQRDGEVAAFGELLGYSNLTVDGALVYAVSSNTPAARAGLQPGDVIQAVDGVSLQTQTALSLLESTVSAHRVGQTVNLDLLRRGKPVTATVGIEKNPTPPPAEIMGIEVEPDYTLPVPVSISVGNIGGPSAGLSWALALVQLLGPDDLTRGRVIADTGTIDYKGNVGDIGGIQQKVYGAEAVGATIFVCPKDQAADARAAAAKVGYHLDVIGVTTLAEAVAALKAS
jgi:PDZ domain-containing protein